MRDRVGLVGSDRGLVVLDRVIENTLFEQQISDVRKRRREARNCAERRREIAERTVALAHVHVRNAAFVVNARAFVVASSIAKHRCEAGHSGRRITSFEFGDGAFEGVLGCKRASDPEVGQHSAESEHVSEMLNIDVITLFPEMFAPAIGLSIVGRAVERGLTTVRLHHLLEFCESERADDAPYGGGAGMVLRLEPISRALDAILAVAQPQERRAMVLTSPTSKRFGQQDAVRFAGLDRLVVICGHYEGVDDRLRALYQLEEISLGDFILTGGEIPALAIVDATVRLLEGAIRPESRASESFSDGGEVDYPAFTRPARFRGVEVPEVLLSGDHAKIAAWRREESRRRAAQRRRDSE